MKWLLVLLVILAGIWWLRQTGRGRRLPGSSHPRPPTPSANNASTRPMTQCLQCGLHLPREDAVQGQLGDYCSPAHRQLHEG